MEQLDVSIVGKFANDSALLVNLDGSEQRGAERARMGEEVAAWIALHEGQAADAEELRAFARQGLAHFKVPRYVRIVTEFPMTVTGKIQKFRMRERMERDLTTADSTGASG